MKAKKLFTALLAITFIVGCTKPRKAKFADEAAAGATYAVSELQNVKVQATTQAAEDVTAQAVETSRVKIAKTNASARLNALLVGLEITGKPATQYNLLVTVGSDAVTVFKIVESDRELSASERQTSYKNNGLLYAPIAQIKVQAYGVIEREKNANGERTSTLTLKSTPFSRASHVRLDANTDNVMAVDKEYANMLRVYDIKGKEFLFRRTFAKVSNTFAAAPGWNGNMEVVRFDLKKDRVSVRKVFHARGDKKGSEANKEEILSVEAEYFRRDGSSGGSMPTKLVKSAPEQAEYVQIKWATESSTYHSPVNSIAAECIRGQTLMITNIDNRMEEGVLSLTKATTATMAPECSSQFTGGGYALDDNQQRNFELEERLSFRLFDKTKMENPVADLPYPAQTALGFGLFTGGKSDPDQFGNTGFIDNEKAMPILFDFSKGKVVRYVLGGLGEAGDGNEQIRETLIQSAKQVIADWNNTLKYAFHGSELERKGPYVELLIEGVDIKKGELGDLDRNYIWNYMDSYDGGLAGLAQPSQNPLTGRIESANVLMYPGNLVTIIGYMKRIAKVQQDYEKFKQDAVKETPEVATEKIGAGCGENCSDVTEGDIEEFRKVIAQTTSIHASKKVSGVSRATVRASLRPVSTLAKAKRKNAVGKAISDLFLAKILNAAVRQNALSNPFQLESIVANEVLAAAKAGELGQLDSRELAEINLEAKQKALKLGFAKQVESQGGCLHERSVLSATSAEKVLNQDLNVTLANEYKWTLAHELGHVFGLTHNFIASYDKANHSFKGEQNSKRLYSSVMDYIDSFIVPYAGPGPYDAHAVRAGYTGRIELVDGKFITLDQLKKVLKLDSWWKLDAAKLAGAPFKKYLYCNDYEAGEDPACERHDLGTSYSEIVTNKINDYKEKYSWLNNRGDRVNYGSSSNYIARLINTMVGIRKMNEETVYKIMFERDKISDMVCAYRKAKNFFLEVVGTPTTSLGFNDPGRFQLHEIEVPKLDATGCDAVRDQAGKPVIEKKQVIIESKSLEDRKVPGQNALETRGIQFDKVFATMMLTERDLGIPRYSSQNIEMSFADFDAIFFDGKDVDSNLILNVLNSSLADRAMPIYADGILIDQLPATFDVDSNSLTRSYTLLSTAVLLEANISQGPSNLATHFRVGSTRTVGNRMVVGLSSLKLDDADQMKYYALSNATAAQELVKTAAVRRLLLDDQAAIVENLKQLAALIPGNDEEKLKAGLEKLTTKITELNKDGLILSPEQKANGITEGEFAAFILSRMGQVVQIVEGVAPKIENEQQLRAILQQAQVIGKQNASFIKSAVPLLGFSNEAILAALYPEPEEVDESNKEAVAAEGKRQIREALVNALMPDGLVESQHDLIVQNLSQLNEFFNMLHPELTKN